MTNEILTTAEIDACSEIYGIGMGSAANTLAQVLDKSVSISKLQSSQVKLSDLDTSAYENGLFAGTKFSGGLYGDGTMLYSGSDIGAILNILMGTTELDEMGLSTIQEILNMMMQTCVVSINEFLQNTSVLTLITHVFDKDILPLELGGTPDTNVMVIEFQLEILGIVTGKFVFLVMPELSESMIGILTEMGMIAPEMPSIQELPEPIQETSVPVSVPSPPQNDQAAMQNMLAQQLANPTSYPQDFAQPAPNYSQNYPAPQPQPQYDYSAYYAQYYPPEPEVKVKKAEFPDFGSDYSFVPHVFVKENMDNLMRIDLRVSAELGKVKWKLKDIVGMKMGDLLQIEKSAGAPVELVANKQTIGYGDVVVIGDNFYIRITEIFNDLRQKKKR